MLHCSKHIPLDETKLISSSSSVVVRPKNLTMCLFGNFNLGSKPAVAMGTKIICSASEKTGPKTEWNCTITGADEKKKLITLEINIPASAIVGRYSVFPTINIVKFYFN